MQEINVKMGDLQLVTKPGVILVAPSLASSVGVAVYDTKSRMAGMVNIVLPDSSIAQKSDDGSRPGKYADTAIPALFEKMLALGSKKENLVIKIAGGAQMFNLDTNSDIMNIGNRNIDAVYKILKEMGLSVNRSDTGGNKGRTLKLDNTNGTFYLKVIGKEEAEF